MTQWCHAGQEMFTKPYNQTTNKDKMEQNQVTAQKGPQHGSLVI